MRVTLFVIAWLAAPALAMAGAANVGEVAIDDATPVNVSCVSGCLGSIGESTTTIRGSSGNLVDSTTDGRLKVESIAPSGSTQTVKIVGSNGENLITVDTSGRLLVRDTALPPIDTTAVSTSAFSTVTKDATEDTFYTVTAGSTLTIQTVSFSCQHTGVDKYVRISLFDDANGDLSQLDRLFTGYCNGSNFVRDLDVDLVGDGTRRVLLRAMAFGASMEIFRRWRGFETP